MWRRHGEARAAAARQVYTSPRSSREWNTDERRHGGQQYTQRQQQGPIEEIDKTPDFTLLTFLEVRLVVEAKQEVEIAKNCELEY